jgi:DNA-binding NarL/FixJ family response regulator
MTDCKECGKQIAALRTEMLAQMEELKSIIRFAMGGSQSVTPGQQIAALTDGSVLKMMTTKQHAAMQMWLFSGMNMADIARRMNCSRNTARVRLKALWTKMATDDRGIVSNRLLPIIEAATDAEYAEWSGGLPKNWAATYDNGRIDPYLHLYVKSKEDTYGKHKT